MGLVSLKRSFGRNHSEDKDVSPQVRQGAFYHCNYDKRGPDICTLFKRAMSTQLKRAILHLKRANTPKVRFARFLLIGAQNSPLSKHPFTCHTGRRSVLLGDELGNAEGAILGVLDGFALGSVDRCLGRVTQRAKNNISSVKRAMTT